MNVTLPKIAILVRGTEEYGVGQVARTLAVELMRRGGTPSVIALESGAFTEQCAAQGIACRVVDLPEWPRFQLSKWKSVTALVRQRLWMREACQLLAAQVRELSVDTLVVQWSTHVELAGQVCRELGIACHWMVPNIISDRWPLGLNRKYYQYLCRRLPIKVLPNSQYTANSLGGDAAANVLYLGADEARFAPNRVQAVTRKELGIPADAVAAGIFARLDPTKGQELLWQAMSELSEEGPEMHLLFVGGPTDGAMANRLREMAQESGLLKRLHLVGWTSEPERYYGALDFAVNARIDPEPFGLSVIEAMLMGRPVLVHALGGPAETVTDGVTGWHVTEPTVAPFAAGLRRVMRDRSKWSAMGQAAQRHALERYSSAAFISNYLRMVG